MTVMEAPTRLETGWEPDTPVSDTMLRRYLLNHVDHLGAVAAAAGGRCLRTATFAAGDLGRPATWVGPAHLCQSDHG